MSNWNRYPFTGEPNYHPFTGWAANEWRGGYREERFSYTTRAEVREFSDWRMTLRDLAEFVGGI